MPRDSCQAPNGKRAQRRSQSWSASLDATQPCSITLTPGTSRGLEVDAAGGGVESGAGVGGVKLAQLIADGRLPKAGSQKDPMVSANLPSAIGHLQGRCPTGVV